MFLYFAFSFGMELDFTTVYYLLTSTLIFMTTRVNNMKNPINMTTVLCVMGYGAQLESPTIPIARTEIYIHFGLNKRSAWEGNLPLSTTNYNISISKTFIFYSTDNQPPST